MAKRVPGIDLDNSEGAMNRLADSIYLVKLLARHNDPTDEFHMDEHQVVQVGYQFKDGVTFLTVDSAKTQRFCSADIICRVSVVAFRNFAALPSLRPCASRPNICLRAKLPLFDILIL